MVKVRNDYTVVETIDKNLNPKWKVLVARSIVVTTCNSLKEAQTIAAKLNADPFALDRGNTRADRVASYNKDH
jgi:hypothetical protein|tara:strand:+ start:8071 stop:8289 length:219 start_codon:yes stop_codon:yes gene_type:complete